MTRVESGAHLTGTPEGDSATRFAAVGGTEADRAALALRVHRGLGTAGIPGLVDWIHAPESVLVLHDCLRTDSAAIAEAVLPLTGGPAPPDQAVRRFALPARFGGEGGPDLTEVADECGVGPAAIVAAVLSGALVVGAVGGNGLPLLHRNGWPWTVRRLPSPRPRVPAGSIGLAGDRVCVYPVAMPGGWRLIGRVTVPLLRLDADPVVPYRAGDEIAFHEADATGVGTGSSWT